MTAVDMSSGYVDWNNTYADQPRGTSTPRCGRCNLPASWHVLRYTKHDTGLYCWNRERNMAGPRRTGRTGQTYMPPGGATEALEAYMGLRKTMELVSVDGQALTLADMKRRVTTPTRTTRRKAKPTVIPTDPIHETYEPGPSPGWDGAPKVDHDPLEGVPRYSSNCVKCRYARPGDPGDHRNHVAKAAAKGTAKPAHTPTPTAQDLRAMFEAMGWEVTA